MPDYTAALKKMREDFPHLEIRETEPMRNHTSFKIGGSAAAMLIPADMQELEGVCRILREYGIQPMIIGNGTNLLVTDKGIDRVIVKTTSVRGIELTGEGEITAECGIPLSRLAVFAADSGLCGLEFAHGIPGTLGGALMMNAGAYGGEMKDVTVSVRTLSREGEVAEVSVADAALSYRHSRFSDTGEIVLSAVLRLQEGVQADIRARMNELAERRRESQPLNLPSAGSTFKRPSSGYAAAMIDEAGLKGFSIGGASVSSKHAGFVVSDGGATFDDVIRLMQHIQDTVYAKSGVRLEPEVKIIEE